MPFGFDQNVFDQPMGFRRPNTAQDELRPYMPTPEQVATAEADQNRPGLFWRALQIPNRLFGGQMVTGFLEGTGRGGIGEGLAEGFMNNPIFQAMDGVFGTHLTKDVNFADVRKAFGDTDATDGIGNMVINTVGDILTSPLELMWSPFGKILKATEGASAFAKGEANFGAAVFRDIVENSPKGLAASVANPNSPIRRALFAFKIPFTENGFAFKAPMNLDLYSAKTIDGMVGWLNSNPATSAVMNLFTRARLAVSDPEKRAAAQMAREAGATASRQALTYQESLNAVMNRMKAANIPVTNDTMEIVTHILDLSLPNIDNASDLMTATREGVQVGAAKRRTAQLLERAGPGALDEATAGGQDLARFLDREFASSDPKRFKEAFDRWTTSFQREALPSSFHANPLAADFQTKLRPNIDVHGFEYVPRDVKIADVMGAPTVGARTTGPGFSAPGIMDRGAEAAAQQLPSQVMREKYLGHAESLFNRVQNEHGPEIFKSLSGVAAEIASLSERILLGERAAGVMNSAMETYLARSLTPEARDMLGAVLTKASEGRVNMESTIMEINMWVRDHGTKLSNYLPMKEDGGKGSIQAILTKIFPQKMLDALQIAGRNGDEAAAEAFSFMATNPFYAMHTRIQNSAAMLEKAAFQKGILESPLVVRKTKFADLAENQRLSADHVGVIFDPKHGERAGRSLAPGEYVKENFEMNSMAAIHQAREAAVSETQMLLDEWHAKLKPGEDSIVSAEKAILDHHEGLRDIMPNDLDPNVGPTNGRVETKGGQTTVIQGEKKQFSPQQQRTNEYRTAQRIAELTEPNKTLTGKGSVSFEPIAEHGNVATKTDVTSPNVSESTYTRTSRVTNDPSRRVKDIEITPEYRAAVRDRFRNSLEAENATLSSRLNDTANRIQYWANKAAASDEELRVALQSRNAVAERGSLYELVADPAALKRRYNEIADVETRLRGFGQWSPEAEAELSAAKATLDETKSKIDELRANLEGQMNLSKQDLADLEKGYTKETEFGKMRALGIAGRKKQLSLIDQAAGAEAPEAATKFEDKLVLSARNFDYAARTSEVERLHAKLAELKQGRQESLKTIRGIFSDIMGTAKEQPAKRIGLIKDALSKSPHGSEMIDELAIALEQQKNGTMPLQKMDEYFQAKADRLNAKLGPNETPVNPRDLRAAWDKRHPDAEIHWMPKEVHKGVYGDGGMWERMFSPTSLAKTWPLFDRISSWWKSATVMPPWFWKARVRDVMSTQLGAMAGLGVVADHLDYSDAWKITRTVRQVMQGDYAAAEKLLVETGEGPASALDVIHKGFRTGGLNGSMARDEFAVMTAATAGTKDLANQQQGFMSKMFSGTDSWWARAGGKQMEFLDNTAKLAQALAYSRKNKCTIEEAFNAIKPFVYDPARADLSNAERYIFKKVIPFYSYAKFAVETQLKSAFQKPSTLTWWEKAHANANKAMGMNEAELSAFMPEFIRTNLGIPVEKRPDGLVVRMFGNFLPFAEVNRLAQTIVDTFDSTKESGIKDYIGGQLNPLIRIPIESAINRSFFTQRKIEQFEGQQGEMFGVPMSNKLLNALKSIRFLNELDQTNVLNFGDVSKLMEFNGAVERKQYADTSLWDRLKATSSWIDPGGKPTFLSSENQMRAQQGRVEQEISALKHQLRVQVERGNESTQGANVKQLQSLLAQKLGQQAALESAATKIGLTKDRKGVYRAPVN